MFRKAHQDNCKQAELDKKKAEKERGMEKSKTSMQNSKDVGFWSFIPQIMLFPWESSVSLLCYLNVSPPGPEGDKFERAVGASKGEG